MVVYAGSPYPGAYHQFLQPGSALSSPPHADIHTDTATAVQVTQLVLGLNPEGTHNSVRERLDALAAGTGTAGRWIAYNAEFANVSTGVGGGGARYKRLNDFTIAVHVELIFGAGSAITGSPTFKVPFAPRTGTHTAGTYSVIRFGATPRTGSLLLTDGRTVQFIYESNASGLWDASAPTSGAENDVVAADIVYETQDAQA